MINENGPEIDSPELQRQLDQWHTLNCREQQLVIAVYCRYSVAAIKRGFGLQTLENTRQIIAVVMDKLCC